MIGQPAKGSPPAGTNQSQEFLVHPATIHGESVTLISSCLHGGLLALDVEQKALVTLATASLNLLDSTKVNLCTLLATRGKEGQEIYQIQTISGRYAVGCGKTGYITLLPAESASPSKFWRMEILSGELCFLQAKLSNGSMNVCCSWQDQLSVNKSFGGWEVWRFVDVPGSEGHFWINSWSHDNKILIGDGYDQVTVTNLKWPLPRAAKWSVKKVKGHGVLIESAEEEGRYLALNVEQGKLCTAKDPNNDDSRSLSFYWEFEPAHRNSFRIVTNEALLNASRKTKEGDEEAK